MRGALLVSALLLGAGPAHAEQPPPALDVSFGGGALVPVEASGVIRYGSVAISTFLDARNAVGLRLAAAPAPLPGAGGTSQTPAWAALIDYRAHLGRSERLDPFFIASAGFAAADRSAEGLDNLALGGLQLGGGLEMGWALSDRQRLFVAPQVGVVPGVLYGDGPFSVAAPTAAVRIGIRSQPLPR